LAFKHGKKAWPVFHSPHHYQSKEKQTFDGDFMFSSARMSEQINLNANFADTSFFDAWQFCEFPARKTL
jgi:hypothetical protein